MSKKFGILIYHRVLDEPDSLRPFEVDRYTFAKQLEILTRFCSLLPLSEALERSRDGTLPPRSICITFDDGYADNSEIALPLLLKYGAVATFFVATAYIDGNCMFNDLVIEAVRGCRKTEMVVPWRDEPVLLGRAAASRTDAINRILNEIKYLNIDVRQEQAQYLANKYGADLAGCRMMVRAQIRGLAEAGMDIGGHTVSHPILRNVTGERSRAEIEEGKATLEEIVQRDICAFAYPNGRRGTDYSDRDVAIVEQCGFEYALTTEWDLVSETSPSFELPRVSIGQHQGWRLWMKAMLQRY